MNTQTLAKSNKPIPPHWGRRYRYFPMAVALVITAITARQATILSILHAYKGGDLDSPFAGSADPSLSEGSHQSKSRSASMSMSAFPSMRQMADYDHPNPTLPLHSSDQSDRNGDQSQQNHLPEDTDDDEAVPFRTWKPFDLTKNPFPCYPPIKQRENGLMITTPSHEGILFQRPTKVGSTTMTNVVMRLAHNRGIEQSEREMRELIQKQQSYDNTTTITALIENEQNELSKAWRKPIRCRHRANHGSAIKLDYSQRYKDRSFLFSLVRDPTKRFISQYFHFMVSIHQREPVDKDFQKEALNGKLRNELIQDTTFRNDLQDQMMLEWRNYLKQWKSSKPLSSTTAGSSLDYHKIVSEILDQYDFIAVMERMDESLVALKLLLGLTVEEILYVKASRSGGSFSNGPKDRPCVYLIPSFLTPGMKRFFYEAPHNARWMEFSKGDRLLHKAANKSLDATINDVFGKDRFARELLEFQNAQAYARAACTSEPNLVLGMCDETGYSIAYDPNRTTTCYIWSEGCDHKCLNERVPNPLPRAVLNGTQTWEG